MGKSSGILRERLPFYSFWVINGLAAVVGIWLSVSGKNTYENIVLGLLATIFLNMLNLHFETRFSVHERIRAEIVPTGFFSKLLVVLNSRKEVKSEMVDIGQALIRINELESKRVPGYAVNLAWRYSQDKLSRAKGYMTQISHGEIWLSKNECLNATIECMEGVKHSVFAISFPDVNFWLGEDGRRYLAENEKAVKEKKKKISRYFVIRNRDLSMLGSNWEKFENILGEHLRLGQVSGNRLKTFLVYEGDLKLHNIKGGYGAVPDVSIYDQAVVSKWEEREGPNNSVDVSFLMYDQSSVSRAVHLEDHFRRKWTNIY